MEVRHDERVANHIDPEPCVVTRKGEGEASAGEFTGQPLSRVRIGFRVPTPLRRRKATRWDAQARVSQRPDVVVEPGMWRSCLRGNREIPGSASGHSSLVRTLKARSRNR